jgi:hypothetical protein
MRRATMGQLWSPMHFLWLDAELSAGASVDENQFVISLAHHVNARRRSLSANKGTNSRNR